MTVRNLVAEFHAQSATPLLILYPCNEKLRVSVRIWYLDPVGDNKVRVFEKDSLILLSYRKIDVLITLFLEVYNYILNYDEIQKIEKLVLKSPDNSKKFSRRAIFFPLPPALPSFQDIEVKNYSSMKYTWDLSCTRDLYRPSINLSIKKIFLFRFYRQKHNKPQKFILLSKVGDG